ncbi:MAG: dihydroorotase [Lachnospiraceae bacterium]|nr:dihydroorotase [Lachnospiraceae bacterium]
MVIRNIRIIDPANNRNEISDLFIRDKKIVSENDYNLASSGTVSGDTEMDGTGLIAGPGLVDVHVHFRDPGQTHKETIHTGAMAAVAGGFTSVVMMANTVPPIDDAAIVRSVIDKASKEPLHIYTCATLTKQMAGKECCDYRSLLDAGAVGFTDDGKPVMDEQLLGRIFDDISLLKVPVSLHEEDPRYITENGVNSGEAANALGLSGSDRQAEISMIERDLDIASKSGVILNIQHISTAEGVEAVRQAKKTNPNIHAEATPHHFTLTDSAVIKHGTNAKMNPPLRKADDREAIWEGLADGTIDIIATDHAPHSLEEKSRDFVSAPSGIIGLETSFLLAYQTLIQKEIIDYDRLFRLMSLNPARLYGLDAGTLSEGSVADITIFSPEEETVYESSRSRSSNSPFLGCRFSGKIRYTIVNGDVVYAPGLQYFS